MMSRLSVVTLLITFVLPGLAAQEETPIIPLETIVANPVAFSDLKVSFVVQFHAPGDIDSPFRTQFERDWYINFSGWPDGAPVWQREIYATPFRHLFMLRRSQQTAEILAAPRFSRWMLTGRVSSIYQDRPWIEVTHAHRLDTEMNAASHRQMVRGIELSTRGLHREAALAFRAADQETLPKDIRGLVLRKEAESLDAQGKTGEALARLETAREIFPQDPATLAAIETLRVRRDAPTVTNVAAREVAPTIQNTHAIENLEVLEPAHSPADVTLTANEPANVTTAPSSGATTWSTEGAVTGPNRQHAVANPTSRHEAPIPEVAIDKPTVVSPKTPASEPKPLAKVGLQNDGFLPFLIGTPSNTAKRPVGGTLIPLIDDAKVADNSVRPTRSQEPEPQPGGGN